MVVVVIIGLLATLAIPAYLRVQRAGQNSRIGNDLRIFAQAFEVYNTVDGTWPANVAAGVVPTSPVPMDGDFKADVWAGNTAIGGRWNWNRGNFGFAAGISISGFSCDDSQLVEIDAKIDDGDLATGNFQRVAPNREMLILEP